MAGRQRSDIPVKRKWLRHAAEQMEADHTRWFRVARNVAACKQRLNLGGKAERPSVVCGVKRLDAVRIACKEKATPRPIPYDESKHATEPMHHVSAVMRIE